MKKSILCISDHYHPAQRGGGVPHALRTMIAWLKADFHFRVITHDFDVGAKHPMSNINHHTWNSVDDIPVWYLSSKEYLGTIIRQTPHDMIYVNSLFGMLAVKLIIGRLIRRVPHTTLMIAPHGELYDGALSQKYLKKRAFLLLMKRFGAYHHVLWHATTEEEAHQITQHIGVEHHHIRIAPILSAPITRLPKPISKRTSELKIIFFSRITPKKNLDGALRLLARVKHPLQFDIYGTIEDGAYWQSCELLMRHLPQHIQARYCGAITAGQIELFSQYHLFLFPTRGENFGYVIQESLLGGCLPLISTETPWRGLADKQIGWDVPLENVDEFIRIIQQVYEMDNDTFMAWATNAQAYGLGIVNDPVRIEQNRQLFR